MSTKLENHQREQETMTRSKDCYNQNVKNKKNSNIIDVTKKSASRSFTKLRRRISIFSSSSSSSLSSSSSSLPSPVSSTGTFIASTKNSMVDFYEPEFLLASSENEENNMLQTPFQVLNNHNDNKTSNNNNYCMKIKDNKKHKGIFIMKSKGNNDIRYEKDFTIFAQENLYRQEILRNDYEYEYDNNNNMANVVGGGEYNGRYYYYYDDNYVDTANNQYNKRNSIQSIKLAVKQFAGVGKERKRNNEAYHQDGKTNPFE